MQDLFHTKYHKKFEPANGEICTYSQLTVTFLTKLFVSNTGSAKTKPKDCNASSALEILKALITVENKFGFCKIQLVIESIP